MGSKRYDPSLQHPGFRAFSLLLPGSPPHRPQAEGRKEVPGRERENGARKERF